MDFTKLYYLYLGELRKAFVSISVCSFASCRLQLLCSIFAFVAFGRPDAFIQRKCSHYIINRWMLLHTSALDTNIDLCVFPPLFFSPILLSIFGANENRGRIYVQRFRVHIVPLNFLFGEFQLQNHHGTALSN